MAKKYAMIHDNNLCIGCQACSIACRAENKIPNEVYRIQVWIQGPNQHADGSLNYDFHRQSCVHCENPPCVKVCPTKASYINQDGIVLIDKKKCVGCLYCVEACPYKARYVDPVTQAPDKCTFCYESRLSRGEQPACVTVCPTDALIFGDLNNPSDKISQVISRKITYQQKEHLGTRPKMFIVPNTQGGKIR
ncbi:MAG: 4Fe-4S dicluster domain-containing protein [Burkholderiales bacterium]|jgi:polysulfide reductase chain B|nr:4Fe-4S dicluster domain-containing protein [Burkholderiales bacterium]